MLLTDIHIRSFTGSGLKPYLHSMAKLRMDVLKEFPYLKEPDLFQELTYLKKIVTCKEAIGVLIFDNTTLVGLSLGYPLVIDELEVKRPFLEKQLDLTTYFVFSDSLLLKQYRGRGIGHHFFDTRENHVHHYKLYTHICFYVPARGDEKREDLSSRDTISLNDFWRKRGFTRISDMHCKLSWKEVGQTHPKEHLMSYWMKDLPQLS
jgi:GNAT superfamily N-acetyltransferase